MNLSNCLTGFWGMFHLGAVGATISESGTSGRPGWEGSLGLKSTELGFFVQPLEKGE